MNDLARSEDAWLKSKRGESCADPGILRRSDWRQYLENRLKWAFRAGWDACERCAESRRQDEQVEKIGGGE